MELFTDLVRRYPCTECSGRGHQSIHCPNKVNIYQQKAAT